MSEADHVVIAPSTDLKGNPITKPTRVISPHGLYIVLLEPGVATRVHASLFHAALQAGCSVPGGNEVGQVLSDEVLIDMITDAMYSVIAEDDELKLLGKQGGKPRHSAVKALVLDHFPMDLYETAWENVMETLDASRVAPPDAASNALVERAEAAPAEDAYGEDDASQPEWQDEVAAEDVEALSSLDDDDS